METPKLYRKRYIPEEKILLKDDIIVTIDTEKVVTKWNVLSPVHPFTHGVSCYFIKEGFKISKFLDADDKVVYWYCDIIETEYDESENAYTFTDLLIDVIIENNGFVKVVDLDEIAQAMDMEILTNEQIKYAVIKADKLLNLIYSGSFDKYKAIVDAVE